MSIVYDIAKKAKEASYFLSGIKTDMKNQVLKKISAALIEKSHEIIDANKKDCEIARGSISDSLLDRLTLNTERIKSISNSITEVITLNDPVGEVIFGYDLPNGLTLKNIRVPFGVIGIIFEARPNVTVDSAVLCLKAGSAVILRGSSNALNTNLKIVGIIRGCLKEMDFPEDLVQLIPTASREDVQELFSLRQYIDVLIPRGGKGLIESVVQNSKIPVIETGIGNCHIYIDSRFNLKEKQVIDIVVNAKTQRPSVCNAAEKLLIHRSVFETTGRAVIDALKQKKVIIKGCPSVVKMYNDVEPASEEDWYEEYLDLKMAVKVVESTKEAVEHINKYGSMHSDSIITSDYENAMYFTSNVDSSTVYVNASTRFTDGGQFGMGAEIGISTQKLHFRGPMGLRQITTNKFIIYGDGQIRE